MLDLLQIALDAEDFNYLRFDGSLSQQSRDTVLQQFSMRTEVVVLLISLKAGGVGLNLTAASSVFLLDPVCTSVLFDG